MEGRIVAISTGPRKGEKKGNVAQAKFIQDFGIEGDVHAGAWGRQVSLLALESFAEIQAQVPRKLRPGEFAENITTKGLELDGLQAGDRLAVGDKGEVILEVTQLGKECHHGCAIRRQVGDCIMPRRGIFTKVVRGGVVSPRERIRLIQPTR